MYPLKNDNSFRKKERITDAELLESVRKTFKNYPKYLISFTESKNPDETKSTIEDIKRFVEENAKDVSTSQVRNLYAKARNVSDDVELQLLRPQIAYLLARQQKATDSIKKFFLLLDDLIAQGISLKDFVKVFEAIVAYHKYYGNKN